MHTSQDPVGGIGRTVLGVFDAIAPYRADHGSPPETTSAYFQTACPPRDLGPYVKWKRQPDGSVKVSATGNEGGSLFIAHGHDWTEGRFECSIHCS